MMDERFHGIRVIVQRHLTEDETVSFDGTFPTTAEAEAAATTQLALVREHMARYNAEVRLVDQKKADELAADIEAKGEQVKRLTADLADLTAQLAKGNRRLKSA